MIKSIIVEDEQHSQKTLTNFLNKYCTQVEPAFPKHLTSCRS